MLSPNIVIMFNGNHASIPSGFSRETDFDDCNVKTGSAFTTGGSTTHTHTSTAHTHAVGVHTHSLSFAVVNTPSSIQHQDSPPEEMLSDHYHGAVTSGGLSSAVNDQTQAPTWSSDSNIPSSRTVIFIRSNGYNFIPTNGIMLRQDKNSSLAYFTAGEGKYLRGASAGGNAGSNVGASSHSHTISHTHTANSHGHNSVTSGSPVETAGRIGGFHLADPSMASVGHTHTAYVNNGADTPAEYVNTTAGSGDTISLKYQEVYAFENTGSSSLPEVGDMAFWVDGGSPPIGWETVLYSNDYYLKVASEASGTLANGGSLTHTHSAVSHTHTAPAHNHTGSTSGSTGHVWGNTTGSYSNTVSSTHTHAVTVATSTHTRSSSNIDCSTDSNEPTYVAVKLIQFQFGTGGSAITKMIN